MVLTACLIMCLSAAADADTPAPMARLATKALLLDATMAGSRLVAVGVHGVVITSDDEGATWAQAAVPVSSMLTSVAFSDAQHGWAAGHSGVLLATSDGGRTWTRTSAATSPDDSFLDILALPDGHILASGAYGLYFVSNDRGVTWIRQPALDEELHINRLSRGASGTLYLAAESGTLATSTDTGATWQRLESPYEGSFYGLLELASGRLLAFGLRGHVFTSDDHGASWAKVPVEQVGHLATAIEISPGVIALSGAGGQLLLSRDNATTLRSAPATGLKATAEMTVTSSGRLICVGDAGIVSVVPANF